MIGSTLARISSFSKGGQGDGRASRLLHVATHPGPAGLAAYLLNLHRTAGNQAVGTLLATPRPQLQAQLRIGQPGDAFECEADRVADAMAGPAAPRGSLPGISQIHGAGTGALRRCAHCGGDRGASESGGTLAGTVQGALQRKCQCAQGKDDELMQRRETPGETPRVPAGFTAQLAGLRGAGAPLSPAQRSFFEPRFGHDFGAVRLHTGALAESSAEAVRARAFTLGNDVVFGRGEYSPDSPSGRHLLAHELTHVVQQTPMVLRRQPLQQRGPAGPTNTTGTVSSVAAASGSGLQSQVSPLMAYFMGSTTLEGFASGSAALTIAHRQEIHRIALVQSDLLVLYPLSKVQVIGHSDTVGGASVNRTMGQARADAVKAALIANGIAEALLVTESVGEGKPQPVPTRNEVPEARNRSVEVRFHARELYGGRSFLGRLGGLGLTPLGSPGAAFPLGSGQIPSLFQPPVGGLDLNPFGSPRTVSPLGLGPGSSAERFVVTQRQSPCATKSDLKLEKWEKSFRLAAGTETKTEYGKTSTDFGAKLSFGVTRALTDKLNLFGCHVFFIKDIDFEGSGGFLIDLKAAPKILSIVFNDIAPRLGVLDIAVSGLLQAAWAYNPRYGQVPRAATGGLSEVESAEVGYKYSKDSRLSLIFAIEMERSIGKGPTVWKKTLEARWLLQR
jgi:outer membrane protein OmpA-like peptidoglycan-associated protein